MGRSYSMDLRERAVAGSSGRERSCGCSGTEPRPFECDEMAAAVSGGANAVRPNERSLQSCLLAAQLVRHRY